VKHLYQVISDEILAGRPALPVEVQKVDQAAGYLYSLLLIEQAVAKRSEILWGLKEMV
jgi:hypothetical protein